MEDVWNYCNFSVCCAWCRTYAWCWSYCMFKVHVINHFCRIRKVLFVDDLCLISRIFRLNAKFVVSGSKDTCLKLWEVPQNITTPSLTLDKPYSLGVWSTTIAHEKEINAVCISPNDKLIATGSQDKSIKVRKGYC